ncbi:hypothetical protein K2173_013904 [Erythroxylum novogranatense]|uniref:Uncharacterized protein n=1 Tax=Erythroxylum novogranatense TaxID=1862640 RepID=A0AAV8SD72_9ROSI|nr:hypothetical protein K2173_013904 [Erythroxylum novogranatense]
MIYTFGLTLVPVFKGLNGQVHEDRGNEETIYKVNCPWHSPDIKAVKMRPLEEGSSVVSYRVINFITATAAAAAPQPALRKEFYLTQGRMLINTWKLLFLYSSSLGNYAKNVRRWMDSTVR